MKDSSNVKDIQRNHIIASNTVTDPEREFKETTKDVCEENLVYLRIWSISDNRPFNYQTKAILLPRSKIAQSLSQHSYVTCIVSKVWAWERIQEEIASALVQHLRFIPLTQPQNSFQKDICFYHYSIDKPQRQSLPFSAVPKIVPNNTPEDNSSTMDRIENYLKIEGSCSSSSSILLYPILNRIDFWNAIHPFEGLKTNIKWAIDMVVFCHPSKPLRRLHQRDKLNSDSHNSSLKSTNPPIKIEESVRKRKHFEGLVSEKTGIITIPNKPEGGEKQRQRIASESTCSLVKELQGKHKDTYEKGNCNHREELEPSKLATKGMNDIVSGNHCSRPAYCLNELQFKGQNAHKEDKAIKCEGQNIELYLKQQSQSDNRCFSSDSNADFLTRHRKENCQRQDEQKHQQQQQQQQQSTLNSKRRCSYSTLEQFLPKNELSPVEDLPLTRTDSPSSCDDNNDYLDTFGTLPRSICPQDQIISVEPNDKETSTSFKHDNEEKGARQSEMSSKRNFEHKKSVRIQAITTNLCQHEHKENGRHAATTSTNGNPESREKVKNRTERNKKTVPEYSGIHPYDIICYPKQAGLKNIGNRRLDILVEMAVSHCDAAMDKTARSKVVESVVNTIHEAGGEFVRWCQIRGYVAASQFLACLTVREKFDEALVFRGRPSQERSVYEILKVKDEVTA
jgi:hypothetical protein